MKAIGFSRPGAAAALSFALLGALPALSAESGPTYRGLRSEAQGLSGTASPRGAHSLFTNPAGLVGGPPLSLETSGYLGVNGVLVDYGRWAADNYQYLDNMDSLLARIGPIDYKWATFSNAFALGTHFEDYALSAVVDIRSSVTVGKAVITPVPGVGVLSDFILSFGRGFTDPMYGLNWGLAVKYIYRVRFDQRLVGTTDEEFYHVMEEWRKPGNGFWDHLQKLRAASEVAETSQGVGLNAGVTRYLGRDFTAGAAFLDFPTVMSGEWVMPDLNIGVSYHPTFEFAEWRHRINVSADVHHLLHPDMPWFKQLKFGTAWETFAGNRSLASVGLGLNDGYPTFGVRMGYIFYLSYNYFVEEVGGSPGQSPLSFHKFNVELGF